MRRFVGVIGLVMALGAPCAGAAEAPVQVMVLGTYHFGNPGQDKVNAQIDPVTTPAKQAQLAELAERLARFKPTVVAVEALAKDPSTMLDMSYPAFRPADLLKSTNETVQIGYRLANKLGLPQVYAIDEMAEKGEPDYFPFEAVQEWAQANGKADRLEALFGPAQAAAAKLEQDQKTRSIPDLLAEMNMPDHPLFIRGQGEGYYALLALGKGRTLPGADLNARWYARNARIFAKLTQVVKPGDRVLVVYGAGHAYWLRHFAAETAGFTLVEPSPYLRGEAGK